jgi:hypothetical protein
MSTVLIIGAILTVVMAAPAVLWLTKLIRPPTPKEEAIHRGIQEIRQREARRRARMPYYRG